MGVWSESSAFAFWSMGAIGGVLATVAVVLLLLLVVALPRAARRKLLPPMALMGLYLVVVVARVVVGRSSYGGARWLELAGVLLLWLTVARCVGLLVVESKIAKRILPPLPKIFEDLLQAFLYLLGVIATLRFAGFDMSSLLTTSAILSAVIGFALQDTLGNVFAGLSIQAQRPFHIGDWVEVDGNVGRVLEIGWRATKVLTLDDVEVIVPNGVLAKHTISNFTKPSAVSRRSIELSAAYDVPPERVKEVALSTLEGLAGALARPAPSVVVKAFGESSMVYTLFYSTDDFAQATWTDGHVRARVWYAFRRAGITIPFPQRDVRMLDVSSEARVASEVAHAREREAALAGVAYFALLPPEARRALAERCSVRLYAAGETILRQGEAGDELFVVLRGEVVVVLQASLSGGRPVEIARLGKNQFFGEMSLMTGERRAATVRTTAECELLIVGHAAFQGVLDAHPEIAERLSVMLASRQLELDEQKHQPPIESSRVLAERSGEILGKIRAFFGKEG